MQKIATLKYLSVLLFVVGCGAPLTPDNPSEAGLDINKGKSPTKQLAAQRLAGTYILDREASMAFLTSTGHYDADSLARFHERFGDLEITYQGETRTTVLDGQVTRHRFAIIDDGPNHVTIECKSSELEGAVTGENSEITRLEFTSDGFWRGSQEIPMSKFKEFFIRKNRAKALLKPFSDTPLVIGGGTDTIVQANPEFVRQNELPRRAAHFEFIIAPQIDANEYSVSSGNVPNKFGWRGSRNYRIDGNIYELAYSIDGREHCFKAGGRTYDLAKGNYFRFYILPGPSFVVDQLPIVNAFGNPMSEEVQQEARAVFDSHPLRKVFPEDSRIAIPPVNTDDISPSKRNLNNRP